MTKYNFNLIYASKLRYNKKFKEVDEDMCKILGVKRSSIFNYRKIQISDLKTLSNAEITALCKYAEIQESEFINTLLPVAQ